MPDAPPLGRIRLVYTVYQKLYDEIQANLPSDCEVELIGTEIPLDKFRTDEYWQMTGDLENKAQIIFFDDIGSRIANDKKLAEVLETLFSVRKHHNSLCLLTTFQNLVSSDTMRTCLRNTCYVIFTKSPQNSSLYVTLQKMLFTGQPGILTEASDIAMNVDKFRYLILDGTVDCPGDYRIRSGIFPDQVPVCYLFV